MIDKNSPIPVYYQLKREIRLKIDEGVWKPGACIDSERELCETYDVSRMTIRQAIGELVQEGILRRVKGKGTFVCELAYKQTDMMSFTEIIKRTNKTLKTKVLFFERIETPERLSDLLSSREIYLIKRQRIVDGECIAVETVYIPVENCGNIDKEMLSESLFKILEDCGHMICNSESSISAVINNSDYQKDLEVTDEIALLKMFNKAYTDKNKLLFIEESIYRSDKFILEVNISRREGKIK